MNQPCTEEARLTAVETGFADLKDDVRSIKNYFAMFMIGHFIFFATCVFYAGTNVNQIKFNTKSIERLLEEK